MTPTLPKRLDSIQCLRGVAALLVLFFHLAAFQRDMAVGNAAGMPAAPDRIAGPSEAVTYAVKSMLLIPQASEPILGLGWTLIHEMFFYLIFAFILFLPKKYLLPALIVWAVLTVAGSFLIRPAAFGRNIPELLASPLSLEFIAGGIAGWWVAIFTLPFFLLVYGATGREIIAGRLYPLWLTRLGDWSYSLYLTHYIVLVTLRRIYRMAAPDSLKVGAEGALDNVVFAVLALAISIVTAACSLGSSH